MSTFIGRNVHSGHRYHSVYLSETGDTLYADIDVFPGKRYEVRWRFGREVASCISAEAAEAAFRLALVGTRFETSPLAGDPTKEEAKDAG